MADTERVLIRFRDKTTGKLQFEIIEGTQAEIEATLLEYLSSKDAHSLMVLGYSNNETQLVGADGDALTTVNGKLATTSKPYLYDIAAGNLEGREGVIIFGHNTNVDTSFEVVGNISAAYTWLDSAEVLQVVSSDTDDDGSPAGNGARTVTIEGLDANYEEVSITVTMNGTTNVPTTEQSFLRINRVYVATAGTTGTNEGVISIKNNAATTTLQTIQVGEGQAHCAVYTVPAGKTLYVTQGWCTESSSKGSAIHFFVKPYGGAWRSSWIINVFDSTYRHPILLPFIVPEKSDVMIVAKAIQAGAKVTAGFEGWIEDT